MPSGWCSAAAARAAFAHLGIWRAAALARRRDRLRRRAPSIGAAMAAADRLRPGRGSRDRHRALGLPRNPTGDYNLLPLMSLIKGRRVRAAIARALGRAHRRAGRHRGPVEGLLLRRQQLFAGPRAAAGQAATSAGHWWRAMAIPGALPAAIPRRRNCSATAARSTISPPDAIARECAASPRHRPSTSACAARIGWSSTKCRAAGTLLLDKLRPRRKRRYRLPRWSPTC